VFNNIHPWLKNMNDLDLHLYQHQQRRACAIRMARRLALSGQHPEATMFWVQQRWWPQSESKNTHKLNQDNEIETYGIEVPSSGDIVFTDPRLIATKNETLKRFR
jgi:hypothetical protein